jgi:hypothetical protein
LTGREVAVKLTLVERTPERLAAIGDAVEGLVEIGLLGLLRLTPPALRAGELELGL